MSAMLVYHIQGIRQYRAKKIFRSESKVIIEVEPRQSVYVCPCCKSRNVIHKGTVKRKFTGVPLGKLKTEIVATIPRIQCRECGSIRQTHISFARPNVRYTRYFEKFALELLSRMTCKDVAAFLGVSWDTVKEIDKRFLRRKFAKPSLKGVERIAIDEIAVKKRHVYVTLVLDLDTRRVLHVGEGRGMESIQGFWKRLKRSGAKIKTIAADLSPAYTAAVQKYFPQAILVYDHFHVIQMFNEVVTTTRREIYNQEQDKSVKQVIKGTRFLLLKRKENLDPRHREPERLAKALAMNADLTKLYYLKDAFSALWNHPDRLSAEASLYDWIAYSEQLNIQALTKFCEKLRRHVNNILNWYEYPISTGPLEGINNKIKTLKRQAYGFRDMEYFHLKILAIHRCRYAIVG